MSKVNKQWLISYWSDRGRIKKVNQDTVFVDSSPQAVIAAVADGMGGYAHGEKASQYAIKRVAAWWDHAKSNLEDRAILEELVPLYKDINNVIVYAATEQGIKTGTTLSILVLYGLHYYIAHIGDSRIYVFTGKNTSGPDVSVDNTTDTTEDLNNNAVDSPLKQLSEDHSWVADEVKKNKLTKEQARKHPRRHILTRCLGIEDSPSVYTTQGIIDSNDIFLVCSDGYHSVFSDHEIARHLGSTTLLRWGYKATGRILVKKALGNGSADNVTVVLLKQGTVNNCWLYRLIKSSQVG